MPDCSQTLFGFTVFSLLFRKSYAFVKGHRQTFVGYYHAIYPESRPTAWCTVYVFGSFSCLHKLLNFILLSTLACGLVFGVHYTFQLYERGLMVWRKDADWVSVLFNDGGYNNYNAKIAPKSITTPPTIKEPLATSGTITKASTTASAAPKSPKPTPPTSSSRTLPPASSSTSLKTRPTTTSSSQTQPLGTNSRSNSLIKAFMSH